MSERGWLRNFVAGEGYVAPEMVFKQVLERKGKNPSRLNGMEGR